MRLINHEENDAFIRYLESDDALFHYTRKTTAIEHILKDKKLIFGRFSGTNDPQEYRPKIRSAAGFGSDADEASKVMLEVHSICQMSGFISFCTNKYESGELVASGFLRSRMWSQYGDNHEGACVVISKEKLNNQLQTLKDNEREVLSEHVTYRNPDTQMIYNQSATENKSYRDIAFQRVISDKAHYLFSKQVDYIDECEYRVVMVTKNANQTNDKNATLNVESSIFGVVFGDRFPEVYTSSVNELLKGSNIASRRLNWSGDGYHVVAL
jgi:hypothetical protein